MTISELISVTEARISYLQSSLSMSAAAGDISSMSQIEAEIAETKVTLSALKSLK